MTQLKKIKERRILDTGVFDRLIDLLGSMQDAVHVAPYHHEAKNLVSLFRIA